MQLFQLDTCDALMKELKRRDMAMHMGKALGFYLLQRLSRCPQKLFLH